MNINKITLLIALFCCFGSMGVSQNCGLVTDFASSEVDNMNGTCTYNFTVTTGTTSGGSKSVNITISCGSNTFVSTCILTGGSPIVYNYGPYTLTCCTSAPQIVWAGHTNAICGGTSCGGATILPVSLVKFEGEFFDDHIMLKWQTGSEIDNDYFSIERSYNGTDFEQIGKIQGAGTTNELQSYSFKDLTPMPGTNYYRLVQYDFDGRNEASDIIVLEKVELGETTMVLLKDLIRVNTSEKVKNFEIFALDGRLVKHFNINDRFIYDVSDIENGYYVAKLITDRQVKSQKIYIK